nr:tyrosine-type recombinase/integrase [Bacteroidota bacterium]
MNKFNYCSIYAPYFKQFIAIKQGLGYVSLRTEWIFLEFDKFFKDNGITTLGITRQQVEQWRDTRMNDSSSTICTKYSVLGQFCKFMCKVGYDCYIPRIPPNPASNSFTPHIFSCREITDIFQACDNMRLYDKHMSTILFIVPVIIRLLYATGIRISEALALKNKDVDFNQRCLIIRKSKNGQERIASMSDTLEEVLKQYLLYRDRMPILRINDAKGYFFVSPNGTNPRQGNVYVWFRKALALSSIPHTGDHQGPRVHDFRHTFAVHSLVQMSKSGLDLYYSLPLLSTFLGHKSLGATDRYVRLTTEMYPDILKAQNGIGSYVFPKSNNLSYDGND